jgi:hypothetical protein
MVFVQPVQDPAQYTAPPPTFTPSFFSPAAYRFVLVAVGQRIEELVDGYCYTATVGLHFAASPVRIS